MGGGLLQLVTIGAQDVFISGDPQITFFKLVYKRHTNFAIESKSQISNNNISSGGTTDIDIKREGDLINHMYLRLTNPTTTDTAETCNTLSKTFITNVINQNIYVENASKFSKHMDIMITAGVYSSTTTPRSVYRTTIIDIDYDSNILTITGKYPVVKYNAAFFTTAHTLDTDYKYSDGFIIDQTTGTVSAGTKCPFQVVEVRGHSANANGTTNTWTDCTDLWTAVSGVRGISGDMYSRPVLQRSAVFTVANTGHDVEIGQTITQANGFVGIVSTALPAGSGSLQCVILAGTPVGSLDLTRQSDETNAGALLEAAADISAVVITNGFSNVSASGYVVGGQSLGGGTQAQISSGLPYDMILPTANTGATTTWASTNGEESACCSTNVNGYQLIDKIELLIGGTVIDTITGDLMDMWNELTINNGNKEQFNLMSSVEEGKYSYLPLYFWFNKSPGLALPLIALQYHEVRVRIRWNSNLPVKSQTAELFVNYIYLDSAERRRFAQSTHQYLIEVWQHQDPPLISDTTQARLIFNHPVKELLWRAQKNNGNYVSWDQITLKFNGSDRLSTRHSDYFQRVQPFYHHSAIPNKIHGIHCFSFAIKPEEHQPSGTCNFSRLDNVILTLNGLRKYDGITTDNFTQFSGSTTTTTTIKLNVYALAYNVLNIMSGMGALAFAN
jgi:hypothetical protein